MSVLVLRGILGGGAGTFGGTGIARGPDGRLGGLVSIDEERECVRAIEDTEDDDD